MDDAELSLEILKKFDNKCMKILDTSSSVYLYTFDREKLVWVQTDIGGVLFVYQRSQTPKYSFFILNRNNNRKNTKQAINQELLVELQCPYILYKTSSVIHNIWFHSNEDCQRVGELLKKLKKSTVDNVSSASLAGLDTLSLSDSSNPPHPDNLPMPFSKTTLASGDQLDTNKSIHELFSSACDNYNRASFGENGDNRPTSSSNVPPQPKMLTVFESLKAIKLAAEEQPSAKCELFVSEIEQHMLRTSPVVATRKFPAQLDQDEAILQINDHPVLQGINHSPVRSGGTVALRAKTRQSSQQQSKVAVPQGHRKVAPDVIETDTGYLEDTEGDGDEEVATMVDCSSLSTPNKIIMDSLRQTASAVHQTQQHRQRPVEGLSKGQLKAALLHLIETSDDFLNSLHNAYTASLNRRLGL